MVTKHSGYNLQGKDDARNCCCYRPVKLFNHGMPAEVEPSIVVTIFKGRVIPGTAAAIDL